VFAGHVGVALAASRAEPRVNAGVFVTASLLLDVLLWLFILLGWESVTIPINFRETHQPEFVFPYSHGLLASIVWSVVTAALVFLLYSQRREFRRRACILAAAVVFSHWLLDALVHRAELPLAGQASPFVGVGLWNSMRVALLVEAALMAAGMALFFLANGRSRVKRLAVGALCLLILAFTIAGMTVAPPPPSAAAMAASSLVTIVLVCLLMGWLGSASPEKTE
jgi:hypothetical protein